MREEILILDKNNELKEMISFLDEKYLCSYSIEEISFCDLVIIDNYHLSLYKSKILSVKNQPIEESPQILYLSNNEELENSGLVNFIDDVIILPLKSYELIIRINSLIRGRRYSQKSCQ